MVNVRSGLIKLVLSAVVASVFAGAAAADDDFDIRQSVVKIDVTMVKPNLFEPWKRDAPEDVSGTGVIIAGNRILTNAHVVSFARSITVQAFRSATQVPAKVVATTIDMDLAVLSVDDEEFFEGRRALEFDQALPAVRSTVNAYGFPFGGTQISVTEGIVSRIEYDRYYLFGSGLRIQIDAALNPGNSGGPAVKDGKMVGLVFSRISQGDNVGYLIPVEEIEMFLDDIEDGSYDGKLTLSRGFQTLENRAIRKKLEMPGELGGVMVSELHHEPDPSSGLMPWDVITEIDGQPIDRQGKVKLGDDNRVGLAYLLQQPDGDDTVDLKLLRDGQFVDLKLELTRGENWLAEPMRDQYPKYFVAGPLVFAPVTLELVRGFSTSRRWSAYLASRQSPLLSRAYERRKPDSDERLVIISSILPHPISQGYSDPRYGVVEKLNGQPVRNMEHLIELLRDSDEEFLVFEFAGDGYETLVYDRNEFLEATETVLDDNGIRRQGSKEYMQIWNQ